MTHVTQRWRKSAMASTSSQIFHVQGQISSSEPWTCKCIQYTSEGTALTLPIPIEVRLPFLTQHSLGARVGQVVEHDQKFRTLWFQCHRIYYVHDSATSLLNISIWISLFVWEFLCKCDCMMMEVAHSWEPPETRHVICRWLKIVNEKFPFQFTSTLRNIPL
jgi:hypothetical protein